MTPFAAGAVLGALCGAVFGFGLAALIRVAERAGEGTGPAAAGARLPAGWEEHPAGRRLRVVRDSR